MPTNREQTYFEEWDEPADCARLFPAAKDHGDQQADRKQRRTRQFFCIRLQLRPLQAALDARAVGAADVLGATGLDQPAGRLFARKKSLDKRVAGAGLRPSERYGTPPANHAELRAAARRGIPNLEWLGRKELATYVAIRLAASTMSLSALPWPRSAVSAQVSLSRSESGPAQPIRAVQTTALACLGASCKHPNGIKMRSLPEYVAGCVNCSARTGGFAHDPARRRPPDAPR